MDEERDFYGDYPIEKGEIIGYCHYSKDPIHEEDDWLEYKGDMYLRENFIQMNIGCYSDSDKGINDDE